MIENSIVNPLGGLPSHTKVIFLFLVVFFLVAIPFSSYKLEKAKTFNSPKPSSTLKPSPTPTPVLSSREKIQIDAWVKKNGLNQYGDPVDTAYPGGTPLFNEATGKTEDRYQYITQHHPDRPWCTPRPKCLDSTPRCLIPETSAMCPN